MNYINPWLALLALVLGFIIAWLLIVRRVSREVPVTRTVVDKHVVAGAGVAAAAGAAGLVGAGALAHQTDADVTVAAPTYGLPDAEVHDDAWVQRLHDAELDLSGHSYTGEYPTVTEDVAPVAVDVDGDWKGRLDSAEGDLDGDWTARLDTAEKALAGDAVVDAPEPDLDVTITAPDASLTAGAVGLAAAGTVARAASVDAPADGSQPVGYAVKGDRRARLYLLGEDADFDRAKADVWFTDERAAMDAGYAHYIRRPRTEAAAPVVEASAPVVTAPVVEPAVEAPLTVVDAPVDTAVEATPAVADAPVATLVGTGAAAAASEIVEGGYGPGSAKPNADGSGPDGWTIKGNADSMLYHTEDSPWYGRTKAEVWFNEEDAARAAGFTRWSEREGKAATLVEAEEIIEDGGYGPGSAKPKDDGSGPKGWTIKGNADSMLYHTVASPWYGRTKAEVWFDTEEKAAASGFTRWSDRERKAAVDAEPEEVIEDGGYGWGSAKPNEDGSGPKGWTIKGNADSMLYHTEDSPWYGRTKAEVWFQTEDKARESGFTRWSERDRGASKLIETPEVPIGPWGPGSATANEDGSGPEGWTIKGNADSGLYHAPASPWYGRTKAEAWFMSEEAAEAAGFKRWDYNRRG